MQLNKKKYICGRAVIEQVWEKMKDFLHVRDLIFLI